MSIQKVNHNVWKPFDAQVMTKSVAGVTSDWHDTSGWTDKVVTYEATVTDGSGSIDINIDILISPKGYYELNNASSVSTEDYELVQIVDNHTGTIMARVDSDDLDELQRPIRSMAVVVDNDDSTDNATVNVWLEGWS